MTEKIKMDLESPEGQYLLGRICYEGRLVPKNYKEAAAHFHKAAEQGYAAAQSRLNWMYANGRGVAQDWKKAAK